MKKDVTLITIYLKNPPLNQPFRIMRNTIILLLISVFSVLAEKTHSQTQTVNINKNNVSLIEVLEEIESQTNLLFIYNDKVNINCKISISAKQESIKNILDRIQNTTGINYSIEGGHIILSHNNDASTPRTQQEERKISGTVVDNAGEPIIGANVVVKGSTNGTTTDINGNFSLFASSDAILSITYIGYNSKDVAIENQSIIKIILSEDTQTLEEVVVIGYGTMRKSDVTGSVSSINSDDFNVGVITSPTDMMQGRMSGVNITMNGGEPGAGSSIRIRGSNSIRSGQEPLYVIDGIPLETNNSQPSGASIAGVGNSGNKNPLNFLNPNDIESIDVLKDASATAIYGSRGANGVILITTKKGKTGAPTVSYSGYMAISSIPKKLEVLNASEFKELVLQT